jgi:hypothetical protein
MSDHATLQQRAKLAAPQAPSQDSASASPLAQHLNASPRVAAQLAVGAALNSQAQSRVPEGLRMAPNAVVQRAVPNAVPLAHKPVADTGGVYAAAAAGDKTFFTAAAYPRSKFRFTERTRQAVLKSVNHAVGADGEVTQSTDAASGHLVHAAGLQLDHSPDSWDSISGYMNA